MPKLDNNGSLTVPVLQLVSGSSTISMPNGKAGQEYVLTTDPNVTDWSKSVKLTSDAPVLFAGKANAVNYVFTRLCETETRKRGTKTAFSSIYNGEGSTLQGIVLNVYRINSGMSLSYTKLEPEADGSYNIKQGERLRIEAKPVPDDAAFGGIMGSRWYIGSSRWDYSSSGTLYS